MTGPQLNDGQKPALPCLRHSHRLPPVAPTSPWTPPTRSSSGSTGADQPYKKLQRALKAEIDEAAWSTLYSTVSRPFDPPSTGMIAVKVINHCGDEVLKVHPC